MSRALPRAVQRQRGNVALLIFLLIFILFAFAAFAFDLSWARLAGFQLQNANDAAAHGAMVKLRQTGSLTQARATAKLIASKNPVGQLDHLTLADGDVVFGGWNFATRSFDSGSPYSNAVQVNGQRTLKAVDGPIGLYFAKAIGFDHIDAVKHGTGAMRPRNIVVAQDITGSFHAAIDTAAVADVALLDSIHQFDLPSDRVGMQLFTGASQEFTPLKYVHTDYAAIHDQWYGDGLSVDSAAKTAGVTLCNKLDAVPAETRPYYMHAWVPHCSLGGDGTDQSTAIQAATSTLVTLGGADAINVIVMFTDGLPECCSPGGATCDYVQTDPCPAARAAAGLQAADTAAADGISIFTVFYSGSLSDPSLVAQGIAYNQSLVRGIGKAYNTPDKTQLAAILADIAKSIPIALVK